LVRIGGQALINICQWVERNVTKGIRGGIIQGYYRIKVVNQLKGVVIKRYGLGKNYTIIICRNSNYRIVIKSCIY